MRGRISRRRSAPGREASRWYGQTSAGGGRVGGGHDRNGPEPSPLELGPFPACGFRLFLEPRRRPTDADLLVAMDLGVPEPGPRPPGQAFPYACDRRVISIARMGS